MLVIVNLVNEVAVSGVNSDTVLGIKNVSSGAQTRPGRESDVSQNNYIINTVDFLYYFIIIYILFINLYIYLFVVAVRKIHFNTINNIITWK